MSIQRQCERNKGMLQPHKMNTTKTMTIEVGTNVVSHEFLDTY